MGDKLVYVSVLSENIVKNMSPIYLHLSKQDSVEVKRILLLRNWVFSFCTMLKHGQSASGHVRIVQVLYFQFLHFRVTDTTTFQQNCLSIVYGSLNRLQKKTVMGHS